MFAESNTSSETVYPPWWAHICKWWILFFISFLKAFLPSLFLQFCLNFMPRNAVPFLYVFSDILNCNSSEVKFPKQTTKLLIKIYLYISYEHRSKRRFRKFESAKYISVPFYLLINMLCCIYFRSFCLQLHLRKITHTLNPNTFEKLIWRFTSELLCSCYLTSLNTRHCVSRNKSHLAFQRNNQVIRATRRHTQSINDR